jgi:hypothetical protein
VKTDSQKKLDASLSVSTRVESSRVESVLWMVLLLEWILIID